MCKKIPLSIVVCFEYLMFLSGVQVPHFLYRVQSIYRTNSLCMAEVQVGKLAFTCNHDKVSNSLLAAKIKVLT